MNPAAPDTTMAFVDIIKRLPGMAAGPPPVALIDGEGGAEEVIPEFLRSWPRKPTFWSRGFAPDPTKASGLVVSVRMVSGSESTGANRKPKSMVFASPRLFLDADGHVRISELAARAVLTASLQALQISAARDSGERAWARHLRCRRSAKIPVA